jgi:hypothetical protein
MLAAVTVRDRSPLPAWWSGRGAETAQAAPLVLNVTMLAAVATNRCLRRDAGPAGALYLAHLGRAEAAANA